MYKIYKLYGCDKSFVGYCFAEDDDLAVYNNTCIFPVDINFNDISIFFKICNFDESDALVCGNYYIHIIIDGLNCYYKFDEYYLLQNLNELYDLELIYEDRNLSDTLLKEKLPEYYY